MSTHRFLRACRREPTDCTPVWLMRQAGRYLPQYQAVRAGRSFLEMARSPALCTEITLQPVRLFELDAAILFADIMTPFDAVGIDFDIVGGEGPVIPEPIGDASGLGRIRAFEAGKLDYLAEAIASIRAELQGQVPLIGFAGAPFTLACYLVEGRGSRDFLGARRWLHQDPAGFGALLGRLVDMLSAYAKLQVRAGAEALQVFDSWVGLLSPAQFRALVLPPLQRLFAELRPLGVPLVYFAPAAAGLLDSFAELGADVIGLDWRIDLAQAWQRLGPSHAVQGNLDPAVLLAGEAAIAEGVRQVLQAAGGRPGHIFNLGHGVQQQTPPEAVAFLARCVHGR